MPRRRKQQTIPVSLGKAALLPDHVHVSDDEAAHVARLIRLLRSNYWLSHFIKMVLKEDATRPYDLAIKDVQEMLSQQQTVENLVENIRRLRATLWAEHPIFRGIRDEWTDIDEYKDAESIRKLIESAQRK